MKKAKIGMNLRFFGETQERDGRLREIESRLAEINMEVETRSAELTAEEVSALATEVSGLTQEQGTLRSVMDLQENIRRNFSSLIKGGSGDIANPMPGVSEKRTSADRHDTMEYRDAFMNYVCRGVTIPEEIRGERTAAELRAAEFTSTEDVGAVIPTSTLKELIRKLDSYGAIYARVRKLNIQGGVRVPILTLKPVAKWVGEGASDDQKVKADEYVSFSFYGLECKIAKTLLASVVTYEMFQQEFVTLATEAIVKELEIAIFKGSGTGQLTGITVDTRVPAANKITISEADFRTWSGWKKQIFGKMKKAYRNGIFVMAQGTFDGYVDGMTDETGQPIGRVNYGITDGETYRFGGKTVETVEDDVIIGYDEAAVGDVIAVFFDPSNYAINSNMQLTVVRWTDHDDNKTKTKALLICDGKLLDPNGVLIIKKGGSTNGSDG